MLFYFNKNVNKVNINNNVHQRHKRKEDSKTYWYKQEDRESKVNKLLKLIVEKVRRNFLIK